MKKIIVSCAPSGVGVGSNFGMNTVDFSIENIIKENKLEDSVIVNRPWSSYLKNNKGVYPKYMNRDFPLKNIHYNDFELINPKLPPKAILFWGDFQHGFDYQIQTAKRLRQVSSIKKWDTNFNDSEYIDRVKKYFLLSDYFESKELPFKLAMYGVTLFQNGLNEYLNSEYFENLKWLYENSVFAKSREAFSANTISFLKNNYEDSFLGVDCALLNTKEELLSLPKNNPIEFKMYDQNIGVFFGRSTRSLSKYKLVNFVNKISKKLGKDVINIPWNYFSGGMLGDSLGFYSKGIRKYHKQQNVDFTAGDILKGMSDLSLIITDTYHVAINAIALNIPVVCIYESSPSVKRNANMGYRYAWRDKRSLLFQTNNLADFLVNSEDLKRNEIVNEKINNIVKLVNNKSLGSINYANLHAIAKRDRQLVGKLLLNLANN